MAAPPARPRDDVEAALAWYRAELTERLVVHWTGGVWRVPLATRHLVVHGADGSTLGRIVCADEADAIRARVGLRPAGTALTPAQLHEALAPFAPLMARLRALEGMPADFWDPDAAARAMAAAPSVQGPVTLLSAADRPISVVVGQLAALSATGVMWKPAPGAAASAHLALRALASLSGRSVALLQGDHASGAALVQGTPPLWLGRGDLPANLREP